MEKEAQHQLSVSKEHHAVKKWKCFYRPGLSHCVIQKIPCIIGLFALLWYYPFSVSSLND